MDATSSAHYQFSLSSFSLHSSILKASVATEHLQRSTLVIQARMGSERLPGKVLMSVGSQVSMLSLILERFRIQFPECRQIVATTVRSEDDIIVDMLRQQHPYVSVYRGAELDVLDRYYQACKEFDVETCIRITSDCPLIDPLLVKYGLYVFQRERSRPGAHRFQYLSNTIERTFPRGLDFEIFTFEGLEFAHKTATEGADREHVTPFMYRGDGASLYARTSFMLSPEDLLSDWRLTVDTVPDLKLIQEIARIVEQERGDALLHISLKDLKQLLDAHPHLKDINSHICQKAS